MDTTLREKTLFITGATRGIGLAIALRAARDGAHIVLLGKTEAPDPRLPGTLSEAQALVEQAGGQGLAVRADVRSEEDIERAVQAAVERFGGIDILVNNASAIHLAGTLGTPMKKYDLMHQVNVRGTYLCAQKCIPHLARSSNPHILTLSPPLDFRPAHFAPHVAYSMAKFGMSLCTLAWSHELKAQGIAANALWPKTIIDTSAVRNLLGGPSVAAQARSPSIVADAAHAILTRDARAFTGNFVLDEEILRETGISDFSTYASTPGARPLPDLFVPPSTDE